MSHVGNGEHDFDGLEGRDDDRTEITKQARIEARDIINRLEPCHITNWPDLLSKLEDSLEAARGNAIIIDPAVRTRWQRTQRTAGLEEKRKEVGDSINAMLGRIVFSFLIIALAGKFFANIPAMVGEFSYWFLLPLIVVSAELAIFSFKKSAI